MNDEIKEILESLDKIAKAEYYPEDLLTYKECQLLLDYITNLQEELEEQKRIEQADFKTMQNLEEENENKDNKILELQQELLSKKLNVKDIEYKEKMIYKSRCEKAIKWIDKHTEIYTKNGISIIDWDNFSDPRNLKNILGGDE